MQRCFKKVSRQLRQQRSSQGRCLTTWPMRAGGLQRVPPRICSRQLRKLEGPWTMLRSRCMSTLAMDIAIGQESSSNAQGPDDKNHGKLAFCFWPRHESGCLLVELLFSLIQAMSWSQVSGMHYMLPSFLQSLTPEVPCRVRTWHRGLHHKASRMQLWMRRAWRRI